MPSKWHLESLTIGPMYHEADAAFWEAALKDFPKLPYLTKIKIIYHYRTHKAFNTSCWERFDSILSDRSTFPRLEGVDVCPTIRSQRTGTRYTSIVFGAFSTLGSSGRRPTFWGETSTATLFLFVESNVKLTFLESRVVPPLLVVFPADYLRQTSPPTECSL